MSLIRPRIAVAEQALPFALTIAREKKCFSSNTPTGVAMYLLFVTRETVDSWMPTSSAISFSPSGFIAMAPYSKKYFCRRTMASATSRIVEKRCSTFFTVQRASCRWPAISAFWALRWRWNSSA